MSESHATTQEAPRERGLARFAQRCAAWTEKWFPDAYVFALAGVVVIALAALVNGSSPRTVVSTFGDGFWDLTAFTLQMAMVVLTGYVVATAAPVARLIERIAVVPSTPRGAVAFVALLSCVVSLFNWGLSLVFSGLLARAIARRSDLRADYRALGAAAYLGLGAVWALGLSSSAAQLQATPDSLTPEVLDVTGVLDFGATILTWQSLLLAAVLIALSVLVAWLSAPSGHAARTAEDMGVDLDDSPQAESTGSRRPGEWLEHSPVLPALIGLITLGWLVVQLVDKPVLTVLSNLNGYLLVLLVLGLVLHGTPRRFLQAVTKAVPATAGVLVQFPLYAAMAAVLTRAEGRGGATLSAHLSDLFSGAGPGAFAVVIALYTAVLGLLVPSGGGKWLVEAPYVMQSATDVHMNLGWTVQIYNAAEALPNLVNPFFMLPLLAVLGLRARDLVGFTFLQFLFHLPVVLLLLWLLGTTFDFVPPVGR